jgi:hypothetical protein
MDYALDENGSRITPYKGGSAFCLCCNSAVIAKCGDIMIHHWAHRNLEECEYSSKEMTPWHREWQAGFFEHEREVRIQNPNTGKYNIADIGFLHPNEGDSFRIIEVQHSNISEENIRIREEIYEKMTWILDVSPGSKLGGKDGIASFINGPNVMCDFWHPVFGTETYKIHVKHNVLRKLRMFSKPVILDAGKNRYFMEVKPDCFVKFEDRELVKSIVLDFTDFDSRIVSDESLKLYFIRQQARQIEIEQEAARLAERTRLENERIKAAQLEKEIRERSKLERERLAIENLRAESYKLLEATRLAEAEKLRAEEERIENDKQKRISLRKRFNESFDQSWRVITEGKHSLAKAEDWFVLSANEAEIAESLKTQIQVMISDLETFKPDTSPHLEIDVSILEDIITKTEEIHRLSPILKIKTNSFLKLIEQNCKKRELTLLEKSRYQKFSDDFDENLSELDIEMRRLKTAAYFNKRKTKY